MFAIIAVVAFGLSLLLDLINENLGDLGPGTLNTIGFLCIALHLAGAGAWGSRYYRRRR